jgi:hypothetical protein
MSAEGDTPMMLSKEAIATLSDLIENRLAMMTISDQDDLREKLTLQRALAELRGEDGISPGLLKDFAEIPRRGRRRKVGGVVEV